MKKIFLSLSLLVLLVFILSGCFHKDKAPEQEAIVPVLPQETYAVFASDDKAQSFATVGCDVHLVKVKVSDNPPEVEEALKLLLEAKDPTKYGKGLKTATGLADGYLVLESVFEQEINQQKMLVVNMTRAKDAKLSGVCDVPFMKGQVLETIRANQGNLPFVLRLDNSVSEWECFGKEESKECK